MRVFVGGLDYCHKGGIIKNMSKKFVFQGMAFLGGLTILSVLSVFPAKKTAPPIHTAKESSKTDCKEKTSGVLAQNDAKNNCQESFFVVGCGGFL